MFLLATLIFSSGFLAQCGPNVSPVTTQAIIEVESGGNPLAIGDNSSKKSFAPRSKSEAVELATALLAKGHSLDLGLMQVNSAHLVPLRLSLAELFDPCRNVRAGTTILSGMFNRYRTGDPARSLYLALSAYNTGTWWKGGSYVNRILAAAGTSYRVLFVPSPDSALPQDFAREESDRKNRGRASSFIFKNLTSAMAARGWF